MHLFFADDGSVDQHRLFLNVSQALGGQAVHETKEAPAVWAYLNVGGNVVFSIKNISIPGMNGPEVILKGHGTVNWANVNAQIAYLVKQAPQVKTDLIMRSKVTAYQDIVQLMDSFKGHGIGDIGIAPALII